jgi:hypothetical protein
MIIDVLNSGISIDLIFMSDLVYVSLIFFFFDEPTQVFLKFFTINLNFFRADILLILVKYFYFI